MREDGLTMRVYESKKVIDHTPSGTFASEESRLVLECDGSRDTIYKIEVFTSWGDPYKCRWLADEAEFERVCADLDECGYRILYKRNLVPEDMHLVSVEEDMPKMVTLASYRMTETMCDDFEAYENMYGQG